MKISDKNKKLSIDDRSEVDFPEHFIIQYPIVLNFSFECFKAAIVTTAVALNRILRKTALITR